MSWQLLTHWAHQMPSPIHACVQPFRVTASLGKCGRIRSQHRGRRRRRIAPGIQLDQLHRMSVSVFVREMLSPFFE